jgi:hypothetical protein
MFWSAALLRRFSSAHESRQTTRKSHRQKIYFVSFVCFVGINSPMLHLRLFGV